MPQNKDNFDPALKDTYRKGQKPNNTKMKAAMRQVMTKKKGGRR